MAAIVIVANATANIGSVLPGSFLFIEFRGGKGLRTQHTHQYNRYTEYTLNK